MYEVWDGDVFLFNVDFDEVDFYDEQGFTVRAVDLS